jgi:hypothetical protein
MGVTADIVRHIVRKAARAHRSFLVHTFGTLEPAVPLSLPGFGIFRSSVEILSEAEIDILLLWRRRMRAQD